MAGAGAGGQADIGPVGAGIRGAVQARARRRVDDLRVGRVDGELEAERAVGQADAALPRLAVVVGAVHAHARGALEAEGRVAGEREHLAAVRRAPRHGADDLGREVVADRAPPPAAVVALPHAAVDRRGVQAPGGGVVREVLDPAGDAVEALRGRALALVVVGIAGVHRALAERGPLALRAGNRGLVGTERVRIADGRATGAGLHAREWGRRARGALLVDLQKLAALGMAEAHALPAVAPDDGAAGAMERRAGLPLADVAARAATTAGEAGRGRGGGASSREGGGRGGEQAKGHQEGPEGAGRAKLLHVDRFLRRRGAGLLQAPTPRAAVPCVRDRTF